MKNNSNNQFKSNSIMQTTPITQAEIQAFLNREYPEYQLTPLEDYSTQNILDATNIYINSDDCTWDLGYEDELDWSLEPENYYEGIPIYFD